MAKKSGSKGGVLNENFQYITADQKIDEEFVNKIRRLHEIFPSCSKNEISTVLEYYNCDETKAAEALTEDGGRKALSSWTVHGNNKSKNNKNKKKNKRKDKKSAQDNSSTTNCTEGDDSSSLHSNNIDQELDKDGIQKTENEEILPVELEAQHDSEMNAAANTDSLDHLRTVPFDKMENHCSRNQILSETEVQQELRTDSNSNVQYIEKQHSAIENNNRSNPSSATVQIHEFHETEAKEPKHPQHEDDHSVQARSSPRQRTNSFQRSKALSVSEDYSSSGSLASQVTNAPGGKAIDKCRKDLNRQAVSLQRIEHLLEKGLDESTKRLKNSFQEIRKLIDKRQEQLEEEMNQVKEAAVRLLKQRKDLATELKKRVDRSQSLPESEWNLLRQDIKQFVVERKYDDELGKTVWFCWSKENITEEINKFGEVVPVKNSYNQRLVSIIDPTVSTIIPEASHSPSPSSEDTSALDKSDVHNPADLTEADDHLPEEKVLVQNKTNTQGIRVFSNKRYNSPNFPDRYPNYNSRGRAPWRNRGQGGGRFPRSRPFEHRYYGGSERTETRPQSMDKQQQSNFSSSEPNANIDQVNPNSVFPSDDQGFMKPNRRGPYSGYRQMRSGSGHPFRHGRGANFSRSTNESFTSRTESAIENANGKQDSSHGNSDNMNGLDIH